MDYNRGAGGGKGAKPGCQREQEGGCVLSQSVRYFSSHQLVLRRWQLVQFGASRWPVVRAFFPRSPSTRARAMPTDDDDRDGRAETTVSFIERITNKCICIRYVDKLFQRFKRARCAKVCNDSARSEKCTLAMLPRFFFKKSHIYI